MMTSINYAVLSALDEKGGMTTKHVSETARFAYGGNARQKSHAVRSWLVLMEKEGLVAGLDDSKPVCWVRTPNGTAAMNAFRDRT